MFVIALNKHIYLYSTWNIRICDIPLDSLTWKFSRSSGPGGQNVNKLNTKADMRIIIEHAQWIPDHVKQRLLQQQSSQINHLKDANLHELSIVSSEFRTQEGNRKVCIEKFYSMLKLASKEEATPSEEQQQHVKGLMARFQSRKRTEKQYQKNKKSSRSNIRDYD